jgi:hypothetical protein
MCAYVRAAPGLVAIAMYVVLLQLHTARMSTYAKVFFNTIMYYVQAWSYRAMDQSTHTTRDLSFRIYCQYYQYWAISIYVVLL